MTVEFIRRGGEDNYVKAEADSEVTLSQSMECLGLPAAGGAKKDPSLEGSEKAADFRFLASTTVREYICCLKPSKSVITCYGSCRKKKKTPVGI